MRPRILVAISSVSWRHDNLLVLLGDLGQQTLRPDLLQLTLDGYTAEISPGLMAAVGCDMSVQRTKTAQGPGHRWVRVMQEQPTDAVVMVIDDDFRIDSHYIERTLHELETAAPGTAVAWSGARLSDGEYLSWDSPEPDELMSISSGTCAVRRAWLGGLLDYPFVGDYFRVGGDDEALVSYHLWRHGIAMWKPHGVPPLHSVDTLQNDPRAAWQEHGFKRLESRMRLGQLGWTPFKLPPALSRTGTPIADSASWKAKPWQVLTPAQAVALMHTRKLDAGQVILVNHTMVGRPVVHYSGGTGYIREVREDGGMRIDWPDGGVPDWYYLDDKNSEPSVRLA